MIIAITQPNRFSASETFIRNHIKHLGEYATVHNLSGGWVPFFANENPIFPAFLAKAEQAFAQILLRREFMQGFTARAVAAYLRKHKVQVVLAEYGPSGVAMLPICKRLGIPLVVHFHGLDAHGTDIFKQYGEAYKNVFAYASAVVGVSTHMCKRLVEMGCPKEKVHYIVYGIDTKFTTLNVNLNNQNFLMVGRLVDKKAPNLTIEAFAKVVQHFPDAVLRIAGDGPLLPLCVATIKRLNIERNVQILGMQTHEQVAALYNIQSRLKMAIAKAHLLPY
jgi:colanic acid/amylovoran biosynthesis glycosyltransferase